MFKAIWHEKQILIVLVWSGLVFIGYNILTVEATTAEKNDSPKEICKNHDGKWKDGSCTFPNDNERHDSEVGFDHTMEEKGLWDDYAAEQQEQENKKFKEDEGKRYVNPDGGAPLYEEELTEEEKDYYEEIKPEKEKEDSVQEIQKEI